MGSAVRRDGGQEDVEDDGGGEACHSEPYNKRQAPED